MGRRQRTEQQVHGGLRVGPLGCGRGHERAVDNLHVPVWRHHIHPAWLQDIAIADGVDLELHVVLQNVGQSGLVVGRQMQGHNHRCRKRGVQPGHNLGNGLQTTSRRPNGDDRHFGIRTDLRRLIRLWHGGVMLGTGSRRTWSDSRKLSTTIPQPQAMACPCSASVQPHSVQTPAETSARSSRISAATSSAPKPVTCRPPN